MREHQKTSSRGRILTSCFFAFANHLTISKIHFSAGIVGRVLAAGSDTVVSSPQRDTGRPYRDEYQHRSRHPIGALRSGVALEEETPRRRSSLYSQLAAGLTIERALHGSDCQNGLMSVCCPKLTRPLCVRIENSASAWPPPGPS